MKSITFDMQKPAEEWRTDDIRRWFDSHKVPDNLVNLFDFQSLAEMHQYASKLEADSHAEFLKYKRYYAKNYPGNELEEYIFDRFKNALFSLTKNYSKTLGKPKSSRPASTVQSTACAIL